MVVKEWRVSLKGSTQGNYIIANSRKSAISKAIKNKYTNKKPSDFNAVLWKKGKNIYSLRLTPKARKRMKL